MSDISMEKDKIETIPLETKKENRNSNVLVGEYRVGKKLGSGSFGKVVLVVRSEDEKEYAMKIIKKGLVVEKKQIENLRREFAVMQLLGSPFVTKLYEVFQTSQELCFVMDYENKGNFLQLMLRIAKMENDVARFYSAELFCGIKYLHGINIIHQDIKLSNLLLTKTGHLKICDFGLSHPDTTADMTFTSCCGSLMYLAPEKLLRKPYTRSADWWAFGAIIMNFLGSGGPFEREKSIEIMVAISHLDKIEVVDLPEDVFDLTDKIFTYEEDRLTQDQIQSHRYFETVDWDNVENQRIPVENVFDLDACTATASRSDKSKDDFVYTGTEETEKMFEIFNFKRFLN
ncbi:hypothetical protein CAEBREN_09843 [Caenorhabditis brenneri]|uniref:non-specific serine/threonine protein kinase n=1 Tax=Caenorhabditis brenneri TaxID=135651 RepID=G0MQR1_CAEBE|nr:hypothetical protein CAEBREN_09843 [Caenorhabditis brenneri]